VDLLITEILPAKTQHVIQSFGTS